MRLRGHSDLPHLVRRIPQQHAQGELFVFLKQPGDIERKALVHAGMLAQQNPVQIHRGLVVHAVEHQPVPFAPNGRARKRGLTDPPFVFQPLAAEADLFILRILDPSGAVHGERHAAGHGIIHPRRDAAQLLPRLQKEYRFLCHSNQQFLTSPLLQ